jgi:hypothetical protein
MTATSPTITCPRCGERLPEGFTRCDACGAYLVSHPGAQAAPAHAGGGRRDLRARPAARAAGSPWVYLVVGLVVGGSVGYALHSAVGPRTDGGAPTGPADVMSGGGAGMGGGMGGGPMPTDISAQLQKYRQTLTMDPNDLAANIGLGNLMFDSNQYDKAIEHYTKALEKDPKNADVRVDRAIAYHSLGQDPKAKEEMLAVTRSHPEHRNAWLNLGVVSAGMGDKATAIRAWEQYLKLEPSGTHSASIKSELDRLKGS